MEANLELTLHSPPSTVPEPRGLFLCVYCGREFYNSQAFGGHQNAHKEERSLVRRRQDIAAATRAHAASLPSSTPSTTSQGAARLGADDGVTGLFRAAKKKKARMETQLERERGRSFPDYGATCTGDGLDLSLRL